MNSPVRPVIAQNFWSTVWDGTSLASPAPTEADSSLGRPTVSHIWPQAFLPGLIPPPWCGGQQDPGQSLRGLGSVTEHFVFCAGVCMCKHRHKVFFNSRVGVQVFELPVTLCPSFFLFIFMNHIRKPTHPGGGGLRCQLNPC